MGSLNHPIYQAPGSRTTAVILVGIAIGLFNNNGNTKLAKYAE